MSHNFARLGRYLKFIVRRERVMSPIWIVCLAGFSSLVASLYPTLFPAYEDILKMATTMNNPAMIAMMGPVYGMDNLSQASVMAQECLIWILIAAAIMNIFLINRHTRVDEELGRLEMFRALPVGRLTGSFAVVLFAFIVNVMIALSTAMLLLLVNIQGTTVAGALVFGFSIGAVGFIFAAFTLLFSQLFSTAQGVSGISFALLGLFYVMRAMGDVNENVLSLISPFGLGLKIEVFYQNYTLPLIILLIESVVICLVALVICAHRDHGSGIIPAKKGKANASNFLCSPFGLAFKLCQGTILSWAIGMFMLGASYGSVCSNINDFVETNEMMKKVIGVSGVNMILDGYVTMIFVMMSMVSSVPIVLTALKIYSEEKHGRLEQIFARKVSRIEMLGSFTLIAFLESILIQTVLALGLGLASAGELNIVELLKAGMCYLPAIWVMASITILLVGFIPKATSTIWLFFGYTFFVMYLGRVVDLPDWMVKTTPFGNVPQLPMQEFVITPLIILTLIAILLTGIGFRQYRLRDIG